jgi:thymidylate kinase
MLNVIEGPDYSGKSLLIRRLTSKYDYVNLIAPGHTKVGDLIRSIVKENVFDAASTASLMALDWLLTIQKHNAYEMSFSPKIYISDRHPLISGLVYQEDASEFIKKLYKDITNRFDFPAIQNLIILDVNSNSIMKRKSMRNESKPDRWDDVDEEGFKSLIQKYSRIGDKIQNDPFLASLVGNIFYIDANRNFGEVFDSVDRILIKTKLKYN